MRERLLDLRDTIDTDDVLTAVGVDLRMPKEYNYTWESAESCLRGWDEMTVGVLVEGSAAETGFDRLSAIADKLEQLTVQVVEAPELVIDPDPATLPAASPRELERSAPKRPEAVPEPEHEKRGVGMTARERASIRRRPVSDEDLRAALLIATNMAQKGRSRDEVESYLDRHFKLAGIEEMLDEIYA